MRRVPTPDELERLAQEALADRDFMAAIRYLFRAGLVHLQEIEGKVMRPGLTNRAYLRRYQGSPIVGSLQLFVDIIDSGWYGKGACREEDYQQCLAAYARIRQHSKDDVHAHSA